MVMKNGKVAGEKQTAGTVQAAEIRARCNKLTEAQRRHLRDQAMRLYYASDPKAEDAHRR
jgi:hypothetical protein